MAEALVYQDRRHRRRQETIEEVIDVAVDVMAEHGVAGLSLGEVARRMGVRPPSLYVYFDGKHALYDAIFARGWRLLLAQLQPLFDEDGGDLRSLLLRRGEAFVRWMIENPAYAQLMVWRPVPGYEPSPEAYQPAVELMAAGSAQFRDLQQRGLLRDDAHLDEMVRMWTVLLSGVISQQLSNAPDEPYAKGTFTQLLPLLIDMFVHQYGAPRRATNRKGAGRGSSR